MKTTASKLILIFIIIFTFGNFTKAQADCPCCKEAYKQFDFWVGSWIVVDTLGNIVGENIISKTEKNCVLIEKWIGAKGSTGTSFNYYDHTDNTWNQIWIDGRGNLLKLKGNLVDDKMVLKGKLLKGGKIKKWYYNQITWTPNKNGTVSQLWELYDKKGNRLKVIFLGIYKKK